MHTGALPSQPSDIRKLVPAPATANPASVINVAIIKRDPPPAAEAPAQPGALGPTARRAVQ